MLQQEGDEVCPAMQGSHMQGREAVLVGHIHTEPIGRDPCQFLLGWSTLGALAQRVTEFKIHCADGFIHIV